MSSETESPLESIKEIFATAVAEDNWNVEGEMLYSYYFVDEDVDKLEKLGLKLEADGHDFIDIFELGDEDTGKSTGEYLLHIDKIEIHTAESLAARTIEFSAMAEEFELDSFDGWEFGEVGDEDEDEFDEELEDDEDEEVKG